MLTSRFNIKIQFESKQKNRQTARKLHKNSQQSENSVRFVKKTHRFYFCDLSSNTAQEFLKNNNLPHSNFETIYFFYNNRVLVKSNAILKILSKLNPLLYILSKITLIFPLKFRNFLYTLVATNRKKMFNATECYLPTVEERKYIIS